MWLEDLGVKGFAFRKFRELRRLVKSGVHLAPSQMPRLLDFPGSGDTCGAEELLPMSVGSTQTSVRKKNLKKEASGVRASGS